MKHRMRTTLAGYIYIAPCFLLIFVFHFIPILMIFGLSMTKYNLLQPAEWIGLKNYSRMLIDPYLRDSLINTIYYTLMVVPCQTVLSMLVSVVLANHFRGKFGGFVKSCLFIPVVSSAVLVGTIWLFMLATDGGVVNSVLGIFGIGRINWIGSLSTALPSVAITTIWKNVGYFLVIFYAGLMDIPISYYEAARVDGASSIQQFRHITLPLLRPITMLVVTLGTIWSFQVFDIVYVMTNGGPGRATLTLVLSIYNSAFRDYKIGYASAEAVLMFIVVLIVSIAQKLIFKEKGTLEGRRK